jgi:hypothetical protein
MKTHHVWWPHLDREPIFNPFVPTTQQRPTEDRAELTEEEEEQRDEGPPEQDGDQPSADE